MTYAATAATRPPGGTGFFSSSQPTAEKHSELRSKLPRLLALDTVNVEGNLVVDPYNGNRYTVYIPRPAKGCDQAHGCERQRRQCWRYLMADGHSSGRRQQRRVQSALVDNDNFTAASTAASRAAATTLF
jgi:hypothetical protein